MDLNTLTVFEWLLATGIVVALFLLAGIHDSARKIASDVALIRRIKEAGPEVDFAKRELESELALLPRDSN